ncbi:beta-ketoacyl synthase N-terminal-like domain-containing protein [Longispora sp. NPDC051575]|uniref:beta-ketoacyl-[acyl-carrier-protein] synthase family protein n=1 Tax=Longispora sp. NPDC051575 TaxID=3154943 RepID=UPI003435F9A3
MPDEPAGTGTGTAGIRSGHPLRPRSVGITGLAVASAFGRGLPALEAGLAAGVPAFAPVTRFPADKYRIGVAAELPGAGSLLDELIAVVDQACEEAGLRDRGTTTLLLGVHREPGLARLPRWGRDPAASSAGLAVTLAGKCGLAGSPRAYTTACVSASTALIDAASMIRTGRADRVVVAAGSLVTEDDFAMFDAGRALAADGVVRPFSAGRKGLLLGDGVAAVVLEADPHRPLTTLSGWGRAGDAYHVCQPHPDGTGMARAITDALDRAGLTPAAVGYVNAHGTGTPHNDAAEAAALHRALGPHAARIPVSSTKALHGHVLEASGLLELAVTVSALRTGRLPVNAGHLGPDCDLDLVLTPRATDARHALSLNAAFGGANTALVVTA